MRYYPWVHNNEFRKNQSQHINAKTLIQPHQIPCHAKIKFKALMLSDRIVPICFSGYVDPEFFLKRRLI